MTDPKLVKFNVGGTHYDVSQSLLDGYPSCMLTRISSPTPDQRNGINPPSPIFIDRDGVRFRYVLDYMRDGQVELPVSIPRSLFLRDMDYFGLVYQGSDITMSVTGPSDLFRTLGQYKKQFQKKSTQIDARLRLLAAEKLACDVAIVYFSQLFERGNQTLTGIVYANQWLPPPQLPLPETNIQNGFGVADVMVQNPVGCIKDLQVHDIQTHLDAVGLRAERVTYGVFNAYAPANDPITVRVRPME